LKGFKVLSVKNLNSVNYIDRLVELVNNYLRRLFGVLGSQEFVIDSFYHDDNAELWDIKLIRTVDRKTIRYEMSIDNHTGELVSFGRVRR